MSESSHEPYDLLVIGGGVNGCGIARDAAGRGLKVLLCEKGDLAEATSSASTKLFHGGLRYLEFFEFRLVREALIEREILLKAMPHIAWPLRFVLPLDPDLTYPNDNSALARFLKYSMPFLGGRRPAWMIRFGLFMYDHLGGREILDATKTLNLANHAAGKPLKSKYAKAFEYSDCWVEDARLVVLNARDAADRGAEIFTRTLCVSASRKYGLWHVELEDVLTGDKRTVTARGLVNAGGPWVEKILTNRIRQNSENGVRLVRGSHIVVRALFDHGQPYFLQLNDGRVIFAIPYETNYTLIGTTDHDHEGDPGKVECTPEERDYLLDAANGFFKQTITKDDIAWTYSGVRPLYDDNASDATAATRDYVLTLNAQNEQAPLLNVFGGKITTYRKLAEEAMGKLADYFPGLGNSWTAEAPLPGGDFEVDGVAKLTADLRTRYAFLTEAWALRLVRAYGTLSFEVLGAAKTLAELGRDFGVDLYEQEIDWLIEREWAQTGPDIIWRRSKLGLRMNAEQIAALNTFVTQKATGARPVTLESLGRSKDE